MEATTILFLGSLVLTNVAVGMLFYKVGQNDVRAGRKPMNRNIISRSESARNKAAERQLWRR